MPLKWIERTLNLLLLIGFASPSGVRSDERVPQKAPVTKKLNNEKAALLPVQVDLRPQFERWKLPPRSQGERNTCSVFVTVSAFEYALSKRHNSGVTLSVEYANWACNRIIRNTTKDRGQFFHDILKGYDRYGLCREDLMPYEPQFQNTAPSDAARNDGAANRKLQFQIHWIRQLSKVSGLTDEQFQETRRVLAAGWPVCAGSDHSRLLVGYLNDPQLPGGGKFLTRDSGLGAYDVVTFQWAKDHLYDLFWVELPKVPLEK